MGYPLLPERRSLHYQENTQGYFIWALVDLQLCMTKMFAGSHALIA
jgi:hypothetical protein